MKTAFELLKKCLRESDFIQCSFSSPRLKTSEIKSIIIKPTNNPNELKVEFRHAKHNDIKTINLDTYLEINLNDSLKEFKQVLIRTTNKESQILINKKLISKFITKEIKPAQKEKHNRKKNYILPADVPCDFLIEIGVMEPSGKVKPNYFKKFRQINRFLELVDDLFKEESDKKLHIVDFGCGKSYLTFAIYYYFSKIKKRETLITGIDLKQEVIDHCNSIAKKLDYKGLKFAHGYIHDFKIDIPIDFVVTLHACDTATDDAILFSLEHKVDKMMFVPCCQHELNKQLKNDSSNILLKHGIFKDRLTALVTDTMRSQLLESCGYKVQSMEFIDLEHTAKNILLRCSKMNKSKEQNDQSLEKYQDFKKQWNINPYLEKEMLGRNFI
jgi:2-polyprenyl-3-methyl-5-hydroxy-6-metoxy-1,4-benzoquinol methylase